MMQLPPTALGKLHAPVQPNQKKKRGLQIREPLEDPVIHPFHAHQQVSHAPPSQHSDHERSRAASQPNAAQLRNQRSTAASRRTDAIELLSNARQTARPSVLPIESALNATNSSGSRCRICTEKLIRWRAMYLLAARLLLVTRWHLRRALSDSAWLAPWRCSISLLRRSSSATHVARCRRHSQ